MPPISDELAQTSHGLSGFSGAGGRPLLHAPPGDNMTLSEPRLATKEQQPVLGSRRHQLRTRIPDPTTRKAIGVIAVVATLGLVPWLGSSIYRDEGASLYSAHLSWSNLWAQSQHVDLVLLPYYVLLHFWTLVSGTIGWLRLPSLLAYGATIVLAGWIGWRLAGRWCGIITAALTASSTLLVQRALNARPYALATLAATVCAAVLVEWLIDGRQRRLWVFSAVGVVAAAFHIFAVLAPLSMVAAVLVARPSRLVERLRTMLWPIGSLVLATVVLGFVSAGQVGQINWIRQYPATSLNSLRGPAIGNIYDVALFAVVIIIMIVPYYLWLEGGRAMWTRLLQRDRDPLALALGWAVLPTLVLLVVSLVRPAFLDRYVTPSAPGLALLFGLVGARVIQLVRDPRRRPTKSRRKPRGRWLAWIGAILMLFLAVNYWKAASTVNEDIQGLAHYIANNAQSGDTIVSMDHSETTAVNYYLARDGHPVALWPQRGVRQRYVEAFDPVIPTKLVDPPKSLWLINDGQTFLNSQLTNSIIFRYNYHLVDIHHFVGVSLWIYRR